VPLIGIFIDLYGNRLTLSKSSIPLTGSLRFANVLISTVVFTGVLLMAAMCLVNWSVTSQGTAAAFGLYVSSLTT